MGSDGCPFLGKHSILDIIPEYSIFDVSAKLPFVFHAEKLKYAPLQKQTLLLENRVDRLRALMADVCGELGIVLTDRSQRLGDESQSPFHLQALSDDTLHLSRSGGEEAAAPQEEKIHLPHTDAGEAAFDVLDAMLRLMRQPEQAAALPEDEPDLNYLKQTFADQQDRYHNLIGLMVNEFILSKEGIARAIAEGDVMSYRQIKHKLQPSVSYLGMPDFTRVMEEIKLRFDCIDNDEMKDTRLRMFFYFDKIIKALQQELQSLERGRP